jgi:Ca-activated chloride channel family protein
VSEAPDAAGSVLPWLGVDSFEAVGWLPWLAIAIVAALFVAMRTRPDAIAWPGLEEVRSAGARSVEPLQLLAFALRAAALACLAGVLADPVALHRGPPEPGSGLDLMLVLDTSGSMRALDAEVELEARTRLDLAKRVVSRFAAERVAEGDRVGLIVFGKSAFTQCPLTSDGRLLAAALERVEVGMAGEATALGDALALAMKRAQAASSGSGRLVVLLTDGRNNSGGVPPDVASELAAEAGVRVHTVGIGTGGAEVAMAVKQGAAAQGLKFERHDPDLETLEQIAAATGGRFFRANRSPELAAVYEEIDAMERAPRPLPPRIRQRGRAEPLLAFAGGLLCCEIALARVLRRRIP